MGFLEKNANVMNQRQFFHDINDPITCYISNFLISNPQSCNNYEFENKIDIKIESHVSSPVDDDEPLSQSTMLFLQHDVPVQ